MGHVEDLHHTVDQRQADRDDKEPRGIQNAVNNGA
jgi:hypothetical protein